MKNNFTRIKSSKDVYDGKTKSHSKQIFNFQNGIVEGRSRRVHLNEWWTVNEKFAETLICIRLKNLGFSSYFVWNKNKTILEYRFVLKS